MGSCPLPWDLCPGEEHGKGDIGDCQESARLLLCCHGLSPAFVQAPSSLAMQIHTPKPLISLP